MGVPFLQHLVTHLRSSNPTEIPNEKRASVSVVLRIKHEKNVKIPTLKIDLRKTAKEIVDRFIEKEKDLGGTLEILFMKRAENPNDQWSGQVSFPGGRKEKGENPLQTAIRETKEEIGLDLSDKRSFVCLGRLGDRRTHRKGSKNDLSVSAFVFLQIANETPKLKLAPSEVSGVVWVPLDFFIEIPHQAQKHLDLPWSTMRTFYPHFLTNAANLLGVDSVSFPGFVLPSDNSDSLDNGTNNDANGHFFLWGLTLGILSELIEVGGGPKVWRMYRVPSRVFAFLVLGWEGLLELKEHGWYSLSRGVEQVHERKGLGLSGKLAVLFALLFFLRMHRSRM